MLTLSTNNGKPIVFNSAIPSERQPKSKVEEQKIKDSVVKPEAFQQRENVWICSTPEEEGGNYSNYARKVKESLCNRHRASGIFVNISGSTTVRIKHGT